MGENEFSAFVATWLSEVQSSASPQSTPTHSTTHTNSISSNKRKRSLSVDDITIRSSNSYSYKRAALTKTNLHSLPTVNGTTHNMTEPSTPVSTNKRARIGEYTPSRKSYEVALTDNGYNVRLSMAVEGLRFEDEDSFEKYPKFQEYIKDMVFANRNSAMRPESIKAIKQYRARNAMNQETAYFGDLRGMVIKDSRTVTTFEDEDGIVKEIEFGDFSKEIFDVQMTFEVNHETSKAQKSFEASELVALPNIQFNHNTLPRKSPPSEKRLGMTTPKPDWVFGIQEPQFGDPIDSRLPSEIQAWVRLAASIRHPFFTIENKSAKEPIEDAENQAVRSGAAMVNAQRHLLEKAGLLGKKDGGEEKEPVGCDHQSFAFSCSWVPQMANLHVHWHELLPDGSSLWHMNLLKGYLFSRKDDMKDFRADVHNILDWGISLRRKNKLANMLEKIADREG